MIDATPPSAGAREAGSAPELSALWIDWGVHPRTHSLCRALGIELLQITTPTRGIARYWHCARRTIAALFDRRPRVVIATNPSIVLGYILLMLRPLLRYRFTSDAHYAGVEAFGSLPGLQRILDLHNRAVDLVIVTNQGHADRLTAIGADTIVCPDPLPLLEDVPAPDPHPGERSAFLICSYDADEPFEAVFEAFATLQDEGFTLYVSGDPTRAAVDRNRFPWVRFLGYVPRQTYIAYLRTCAVVLDLTTLENCLVCGAYEALSVSRPLVLSSTSALQEYFAPAAVFCDVDPASIAGAVRAAYAHREELTEEALRWVQTNNGLMKERLKLVRRELAGG